MNEEKERQQEKRQEEDEEEEVTDVTCSENLLSLVQPQMITLSRHWLAALKDHALLSLPPGV